MITQLFSQLMAIEKNLAAAFYQLAEKKKGDLAAVTFWHRMVAEELQHRDLLESEVRNIQTNPDFYEETAIDLKPLEFFCKIIDSVSHILQDPFIDESDLYQAVKDLLMSLKHLHLELEAGVSDKKLKHLCRYLAGKDQNVLNEIGEYFLDQTELLEEAA